MQEIVFGQCPRKPYWCEQERCWLYGEKPDNCASDNIDAMPVEYRKALLKDTADRGYRTVGVESYILWLNQFDRTVYFERRPGEIGDRSSSWHEYLRDNANPGEGPLVRPLVVESVKMPEDIDRLSVVRGSSFVHVDCDMKRLISNAYDDEDFATQAGIAIHMVTNRQHVPNYIHNELLRALGHEPMERSKYCEYIEIFTEIDGVRYVGHPDTMLDIGRGFALGIMDFKRSGVQRVGYPIQMFSYAYAANQAIFNSRYETFVLINVHHAHPVMPISPENPKFHILIAQKDGLLEQRFKKELRSTHEMQELLRQNFSFFDGYKRVMESKGICDGCYPTIKARCDALRDKSLTVDEDLQLNQPAKES